ncbi:hypothetical protein O1L60_44590 [Streptomyces diastatochromogenes]|nr:hypothetical protein [Streptomyces diastatochromogenes]
MPHRPLVPHRPGPLPPRRHLEGPAADPSGGRPPLCPACQLTDHQRALIDTRIGPHLTRTGPSS